MSADIVAADQLKAIVQRVERLEDEIADLNADKSEIYKEARANGFDVKVIKKVVSKRKIDEHEREEQDNVFDLYWNAVHGLNLVHAHARENIEQFDANPRLIKQVVDGMQTEAGRAALIAAVDIMIDREEAEELEASDGFPSVSSSLTTREAEESVVSNNSRPAALAVSGGEPSKPSPDAGGEKMDAVQRTPGRSDETSAYCNAQSGQATNSNSEKATVATQGEATAPTSDDGADRAPAANAGGENVDRSATRAGLADPTLNTGEGAANTALPAKPKVSFRPNCQHPENCASGSRDHCWSCRRAMQKSEEMA